MNTITITQTNLETEHLCCALTDKKGETGLAEKKTWLKQRLDEGLTFRKMAVRGKAFIETIPAEYAWCPIDAPNYVHIQCFWVAGQFSGQGYASQLLEETIQQAKAAGKSGLTYLTSDRKRSFLSDPDFARHKGFIVADQADPYFVLAYFPFTPEATIPHFKSCVGNELEDKGIVITYSHQCPFSKKYALLAQEVARQKGVTVQLRCLETTQQAQSMPVPCSSYALFYQGKFVTNEILSEKKMEKFLLELGL